MKAFEYAAPESLADVIALLAERGDGARVVAGATDFMQRMKIGKVEVPQVVVSLRALRELDCIKATADGVTIGALTTLADVAAHGAIRSDYTALAEAAHSVGSRQIRNRATLVGNVCSASPAADAAVALMALDGRITIADGDGETRIDVGDFFTGPRQSCLAAGQLVTEVTVPAKGWSGSGYARSGLRRAMDCCVASGAAALIADGDGKVSEARVVLGALAPTPIRVAAAEGALVGNAVTDDLLREVAAAASAAARPISDIRGSADYRKELAGVLARRAVASAYNRSRSS